MKMKFLSLLTTFLAIGIVPMFAATETPTEQTMTVSGKVLQSDTPVQYVIISALYSNNTPINDAATYSDANGEFTLENIPSDAIIQASYSGKTQKTQARQNMIINLDTIQLAEATIQLDFEKECEKYPDIMKWENNECVCKDKTKELKNWQCVDKPEQTPTVNSKPTTTNTQKTETKIDPEKLKKLQNNYDETKETEQSKANRLLTSASSAATGIGGMELAQGLSEQKADRAAEQSMSAYIATMRCSYGNGKQVKAGMEEIELPGGNDGNIMKYRAEYVTLAADLKERKTALGLKPGIESEEILDKSQMGLYDDENIGISDGAYASLYRAQMLGSEKDQQQIDDAKQTSKNRVIGGAVAAGVGVVGGIVGDELINQSLSSSTKTAQTCTESGGTWQGGRCHCPDGFIQHTKTGPCFEKQQEPPAPPQGQNNSSSNSNSGSDNSYGNGDNDDNDEPNFDFEFGDITEPDEEVEPLPEAVITYEKQQNCQKSNGQWINGTCVCQDSQYTPDESGKCVYVFGSINQPTVIPVLPNDTTGVNSDGSQTNSSVTPTNVAAQTNPNIDASQQTDTPTCGVVGKKECNSNYYVCASDSDCTSDKLPANATAGHCWKGDGRSVCTATDCKTGYTVSQGHCVTSQVTNRNTDSQKSNTQTAQRPNNTNQKKSNTTNNSNLSKQDMSKNGTFAKAYGTDGKCSVYQNKSWADKSTSWCDDLYKGEWKVQFDYGLVRGKTACDTDGGVEKRLGTPAGKAGQYCWCKVTQYTPNGGAAKNLSLSWMYNKGDSSKGSCEYHCALWCASDIRTDPSIRQKMFNAK